MLTLLNCKFPLGVQMDKLCVIAWSQTTYSLNGNLGFILQHLSDHLHQLYKSDMVQMVFDEFGVVLRIYLGDHESIETESKGTLWQFIWDIYKGHELRGPGVWKLGCRSLHDQGSVVEYLPFVQVVIPGSWDQVLHRAPWLGAASPSACVSAFCVSHK